MKFLKIVLLATITTCFTVTPNINLDTSLSNLNKWLLNHRDPYIIDSMDDLDPKKLLDIGCAYVKDKKLVILPGKEQDEVSAFYGAKDVFVKEKYRFYIYDLNNKRGYEYSKVESIGKSLDMSRSNVDGTISYSFGVSYDKTIVIAETIQLMNLPEVSTEIDLLKGQGISNSVTCSVKAGEVGTMMFKTDYITYRDVIIQPLYIKKNKKFIIKTKYSYELGSKEEIECTIIKSNSAVCHSEKVIKKNS